VAVVVLPLLLPSVADGASVWKSVMVLPAETRVSVGVGTKVVDDTWPVVVGAADAVLVLFGLLFCRTTKESNSGSHRGQGHAVVNVERNRKIIEYNCRFREVRMACIWVLTPLQSTKIQPDPPKKFPHYPDICACAKSTEGELSVSFRIIVLAVEVESK